MKLKILPSHEASHDKAHFSATPRRELADLIQHSFDIIQAELGLDKNPSTVEVGFFDSLGKGVGGETKNDATDPFKMSLTVEEPWDMLSTLAHEMWHVKDLANGDLKLVKNKLYYKGKAVNEMAAFLTDAVGASASFPWEREAYDNQNRLAIKVYQSLPAADQAFLNKLYDEWRAPATLPEYYQKLEAAEKVERKKPADLIAGIINAL